MGTNGSESERARERASEEREREICRGRVSTIISSNYPLLWKLKQNHTPRPTQLRLHVSAHRTITSVLISFEIANSSIGV